MDAVLRKSESLPEEGVPDEIIRLLPHDNDLDNIVIQKAAAPVEGRREVAQAATVMGSHIPNAV
eukprot:12379480-Heterocapsa_arctica.AAC.1